ncbi:hypothetical protein SAMN04244573_02469 [Azotobacter beijerinckii]|uniref:Phage ABA sandwich domain-containing protein n=1 Tax=Azotobacter beijerinckii TaxID=170623 RepID=A0A1H9JS96_9GAMM|nr:hypothetical protein [Azotobacter beijerinckii]SEQ89682.1 hypothetical protein SAMN04244573_02469 [Azotobacter beijerinckii]
MNDRELLELAAKAAGLRVVDRSAPISLRVESDGCKSGVHWNPLTDDGDALRLAVDLNLSIKAFEDGCDICDSESGEEIETAHLEPNGCHYSMIRRAIVRAAAEIGRNMQ